MDASRRIGDIALLVVFVALAVVMAHPAPAPLYAKTYDHPEIAQVFRLLPNGDAEVEDVRTFRFEGSFSWAELRLRTTGQYGPYDVEYQGVWDAVTGEPLRFERSTDGRERVLRWYYRAQDTTRRFRLRYRIKAAVQRYSDVAQFYWKAIEDDHAPIGHVRITMIPPAASPKLFKVFVHSRAAPGTLQIADDFSRVVITQDRIPETSFVEVRALLDPAVFPATLTLQGQSYESLLADERRQAQGTLRGRWLIYLAFGGAVALVAGLTVAFIWAYLRYGREPQVAYTAEYEHEPPQALPPAVVPAILPQGGVRNADMPRAFAATLLEAARLGYLVIEEKEGAGFLGTGLFKDTDLIYRLTPKGQALLSGGDVEVGRNERRLEAFEVDALRTVFSSAGRGTEATSDEIEAWGRSMVGSKSNFLRFIEGWAPRLRTWFEQRHFKIDDPQARKVKTTFLVITIPVVALASVITLGIGMVFAVPVGIILMILAAVGLGRRTPEAALEVKRWEAFRRFMTDFSALRDAGPQLLTLWESYLVYATALGVADRLLKNLQMVAAQTGRVFASPVWFYGADGRAGAQGMAAPLSSLENLSRSFANFQHLSKALSTSTSSGGGFSGGGGGGGGGGSSRAG